VIMKYRQPMFSLRVQFVSVASQVRLPRRGHATSVAKTCARAQSMLRIVKRYWWVPGRNSRKIAESVNPNQSRLLVNLLVLTNRKVTSNTNWPESCKNADGGEVRAAGSNHSEHSGDTNGEIERPSSAKDIAAKAPEDSTEEKTDILGECEELSNSLVSI
jgi:hypothetical protein